MASFTYANDSWGALEEKTGKWNGVVGMVVEFR